MSEDNDAEIIKEALMSGEPIMPTHTCFDDALDMVCRWIQAEPKKKWNSIVLLCHGICRAADDEPFAHAWLEMPGNEGIEVWQSGLVRGKKFAFSVDRDEFYDEMKVSKMTQYTLKEAWMKNKKHGTYGPWDTRYLKLCGRPRRLSLVSQSLKSV